MLAQAKLGLPGLTAWAPLKPVTLMVRTNNLVDFRPLHQETIVPSGPGHFRMVLMPGDCRRTKRDIGRIVRALETKLVEFPDDREPADGATWL